MLFAVQLAAMNGAERVLNALDAIATRVEDNVHEVEILDADELESTAWYRSSRLERRKLLEEIAEASVYRSPRTRGPHQRRVEVSDETTAASAKAVAYAPLLVLLENDVSDKALVEAALRMFAEPATMELCFGPPSKLDPPAIEMESRGGHGELKGLIERRCEEAAARGRRHRLVVVTDSDGEWKGDVKKHAQAIRDECVARGIRCVLLKKRTAENYIPDAVWQALVEDRNFASMRPAVEALSRLSADQRDHVHLDTKDPWDLTKPQVRELFDGVSPADYETLRLASLKGKGADRFILALIDDRGKHALTPSNLQNRDQHGDLLELVRHIEEEL
ncbi:hypothetical protein [Polyangium aurulentum]|uniref:hypothetical protein n=1 Tax=Polyangium aurulentum TaxID=2567896 RepID=UPI0010AE46C1|nr:hypothetical protein [Polyangium aurulentum]UQA56387.1 hypothetical protein E8A73_034475 [Polyangium aurulentum]